MSRAWISRRRFLTLSLGFFLPRLATVDAQIHRRRGTYAAEVGILYNALRFSMIGTLDESVDQAVGRYDVKVVGEGSGIANRVESTGRLVEGRWAPLRTVSWFEVRGRESRSEIVYDHERGLIDYHFRGETFFLRQLRVVDDTLTLPGGALVDDVTSAMLNYVDARWKADADGVLRTHVVRRRKRESEGPDDVDPGARAELAPFELKVGPDAATGKSTALFDMTRFSSWAKPHEPARIVFGPNRRPELITSSLILGTSITVRLKET